MESSFFDGDLQVYDYQALEDETADLGLDEGINDYNDETFGADDDTPTVGRDFDFAGSTSRFLGDAAPPAPAPNAWTGGRPTQQQQPSSKPTPWNSLDSDPLLSRTPIASLPTTPSSSTPAPAAAPRVVRTLDEIEAEQRALQAAGRGQQRPQTTGRQLTVEEVEAEMQQSRARQQQQQQQQFQQQQQYPSPQLQQAFPPQQGYYPVGGPFNQGQGQGQGQGPPLRQPPFGMPMGMPPGLNPQQQQQFLFHQHHQHQLALRHAAQFQQHARQSSNGSTAAPLPPLGARQSPAPLPGFPVNANAPMQQLQGPPSANAMMTLFPPLPSQGTLATVEQQLQYLSVKQHSQHPSLTGVQLHALLQQAQMQVQKETARAVGEWDGRAETDAKSLAGEELIKNVEARIREHELMEQNRKKKAAKIASMANHNNLMSNSDKDFITRIQVSQLVTDDPYADDFYFHIMAAIKHSRNNAMNGEMAGRPMGPGNALINNQSGRGGGKDRRPTRRENAMNKMAQNVQRLVDVAKKRNQSGLLSLDGALGKIALRTRSAPRQLLQVSSTPIPTTPSAMPSASHALLAGLISTADARRGSANRAPSDLDVNGQHAPLSHRAILHIVEAIYDVVLDLEQLRRVQPTLLSNAAMVESQREAGAEGEAFEARVLATKTALVEWDEKLADLSSKLWDTLRVMEPLDISVPHPFISLISVSKGKKILPRALRHLSPEQVLTLLTLMVATFDQLDTVRDASILDATDDITKLSSGSLESKQKRAAVEVKTEVFLNAIISPVMNVIGRAPLRMVTGMLGLLLERNNINVVVKSKPGLAFLTIFLSHAESLKQATPAPEAQDLQQWQQTFTQLFNALSSDFPSLFPSTRAVAALPFGPSYYLSGQSVLSINAARPDIDSDDEPVWRFLAAVAVCADPQEQQILVTSVRDKVMENVKSAAKLKVTPQVAAQKINNLNLLLHALGLDASQLTAEEA